MTKISRRLHLIKRKHPRLELSCSYMSWRRIERYRVRSYLRRRKDCLIRIEWCCKVYRGEWSDRRRWDWTGSSRLARRQAFRGGRMTSMEGLSSNSKIQIGTRIRISKRCMIWRTRKTEWEKLLEIEWDLNLNSKWKRGKKWSGPPKPKPLSWSRVR